MTSSHFYYIVVECTGLVPSILWGFPLLLSSGFLRISTVNILPVHRLYFLDNIPITPHAFYVSKWHQTVRPPHRQRIPRIDFQTQNLTAQLASLTGLASNADLSTVVHSSHLFLTHYIQFHTFMNMIQRLSRIWSMAMRVLINCKRFLILSDDECVQQGLPVR